MHRLLSTLFLAPFLAALMLPRSAQAQSPRMMLVEEATNASCPPCAAQNPFYEEYLAMAHNEADLIPIVFHSNFPGKDVMNAANAAMDNGRVSYYGINGVPAVVVNGHTPTRVTGGYDGAPADTTAIFNAMVGVRGTISPITIHVTQKLQTDSITAYVDLSSIEALPKSTLRVVLVERTHNYASAGTNGEKDFYYIARAMLPTNAGTPVTLAAGGNSSFTATYKLDSTWNRDQMYVVAFVQRDSTHDVLQAASSRIRFAAYADGPETARRAGDPTQCAWNVKIAPSDSTPISIKILSTSMPTGWQSDVRVHETSLQPGQVFTTSSFETLDSLLVGITPSGTSGLGKVTVRITGLQGGVIDRTYKLYSGQFDIVILPRDEGDTNIIARYNGAMSGEPLSYVTIERGDEYLFRLSDHKVVVCEVGKSVLDRPNIDTLQAYIRGGGRLFLAGAEIGWGLADTGATDTEHDVDFLTNDLHAVYVKDDAAASTVNGTAGDTITNGLTFSITSGVQNQDTPDQIAPGPNAVAILHYGSSTSTVAGIRYADATHRLVYLGFGLEGMGDATKRAQLLQRGIAWLLGSETTLAGVDAPSVTLSRAVGGARPNPTQGVFAVPLSLDHSAHVSIRMYDAMGRLVRTVQDGMLAEGERLIEGDASGLPDGAYSVMVDVEGRVHAERVIVLH